MPTNQVFTGNAVLTAQTDTFSVTADAVATTYQFTINGKIVSVLGSGSGDATTAFNWQQALAASTIPEFLESSWSIGSGSTSATIARIAQTPGMRCPLASEVSGGATVTVSGGAGTVSGLTTTVANSGPNDYSVASNWVSGSVPGNGDTITLTNNTHSLLYGLNQIGVSTVTINCDNTYTGQIGLPINNPSGYEEYRPTFLKFQGFTASLGDGSGSGSGSGFICLDSSTTAFTCTVFSAGSPAFTGIPAVQLRNGASTNSLTVLQGIVGVAFNPSDTCTLTTLNMGYVSNTSSDAQVTCGAGCTLSGCTVTQTAGIFQALTSIASLTMGINANTATWLGTGNMTTLNIVGGTFSCESNGTITTATVLPGATLDASRDPRSKTITTLTVHGRGVYNDPNNTVTWTNPASFPDGVYSQNTPNGAVLTLGTGIHLQRS